MDKNRKRVLITGGAGFIGSNLVHYLLKNEFAEVLNVDLLTYAGNLASLKDVEKDPYYTFEKADICDGAKMESLMTHFKPHYVMHLAAESHVDRSIDGPAEFLNTNIMGTYSMLEVSRNYWQKLNGEEKEQFRFLHISTDEVFGSLGSEGLFSEETAYDPKSPYSASKAASDHLVRAWNHTYGLPALITNCSNNYGPFQFPEKLIPVIILNALNGKNIPVYGKGENVRDWLYVEDHVAALWHVITKGEIGATYCIGGNNEKQNIDVVNIICDLMDKYSPNKTSSKHNTLITYVTDRPGHDMRYAIDASKIKTDLGWEPKTDFKTGFEKTVKWYLENLEWCSTVLGDTLKTERLGLKKEQK